MKKIKIPSLSSLIKSHKFDWVNPDITEDNFPTPKEIRTDFKLCHFDRYIPSEDAIKEIEKDGYSPATIYELLSWEGWNDKDWVVALGSVAGVDGGRRVAALYRRGSERGLDLRWFGSGWSAVCRFLAVRNSPLKPSDAFDSALGTSDTLALPNTLTINGAVYVKK